MEQVHDLGDAGAGDVAGGGEISLRRDAALPPAASKRSANAISLATRGMRNPDNGVGAEPGCSDATLTAALTNDESCRGGDRLGCGMAFN